MLALFTLSPEGSLEGFRSPGCLYPPSLPASPLFFSALSVNSVLREARSLTQIDPSAPLLSHRHSSHAAIPFRITFFAHPSTSTQPLPLFSTASKHPTHSNTRISTLFMRLLNTSRDTRGGALIANQTPDEACLCGASIGRSGYLRYADHRPLFGSTFKPFNVQTFQRRFSTAHYPLFTTHGPPQNFYPPAPKLRHNPAAQGQHPQPSPHTGRIQ